MELQVYFWFLHNPYRPRGYLECKVPHSKRCFLIKWNETKIISMTFLVKRGVYL
jgi:hypothetical protein